MIRPAVALQGLSSSFSFLEISNFFRDCAWGLLLLLFLANRRVDWRACVPVSLREGGKA